MIFDNFDYMSFVEWLAELNSCAYNAGCSSTPIVNITGPMCWYSYYEEGLDPSTALEMAVQDGVDFGENYLSVD